MYTFHTNVIAFCISVHYSPTEKKTMSSTTVAVSEPDLTSIVDSATDRLAIRNIIYTASSIFNSSSSSSSNTVYKEWKVKRIQQNGGGGGGGYLIKIQFGKYFRIGFYDMQILHDVCPLRIDSIFVSSTNDDNDNDDKGQTKMEERGCNLCISLLDNEQPVQLTESEVVRIRKRSRGLLSQFFNTNQTLSSSKR